MLTAERVGCSHIHLLHRDSGVRLPLRFCQQREKERDTIRNCHFCSCRTRAPHASTDPTLPLVSFYSLGAGQAAERVGHVCLLHRDSGPARWLWGATLSVTVASRQGSCGAKKEGDGRGEGAARGKQKDAKRRVVTSHGVGDLDLTWCEVLMCHTSKRRNFILFVSSGKSKSEYISGCTPRYAIKSYSLLDTILLPNDTNKSTVTPKTEMARLHSAHN
jgi:hypothetical protein